LYSIQASEPYSQSFNLLFIRLNPAVATKVVPAGELF
jgi:hypothetical protein